MEVRVEHLEVLVEELSMEAALRAVLPRLLGGVSFAVYPHQCKTELIQRLPERLRGYSQWLPEGWRILVVVDRDDEDCVALKRSLDAIAESAGLRTRRSKGSRPWQVATRLAIEELESWYFGDWTAVRAAYPKVPESIPAQERFRDPDAVRGGTWEAFERVLQGAGYFRGGLRKIEAARSVGAHLDPSRSSSRSFRALTSLLSEIRTP